MNRATRLRALILAAAFAAALLPCVPGARGQGARPADGPPPRWRVSPSLKYDALCFLNVLTGDPFYRRLYEEEYALFAPRLTPAARAALAALRRKVRDENGNVLPAFLALHFSADAGETLEAMLAALEDPRRMKSDLSKTAYYDAGGWRLFESVRDDLKAALLFLKEAGFDDYWRRNVLPLVEAKAAAVAAGLSRYDVAGEVEGRLGFRLPSERIEVYVLRFARPHGVRLTGARFVTDASYPTEVVLRMAAHELLHPPYVLARDRELRKALGALRKDDFLADKIQRHDPSLGYNSFESFVEEDCVRALEQVVAERLGFAEDPRRRFAEEDGGMHVLAAALYELMRREDFGAGREDFRPFLLRSLRAGALAPGRVKELHDAFFSAKAAGPPSPDL